MDALDGRIVAALMQEPLAPVTKLCEASGLTRNAVKARLARLKEDRVLLGVTGMPNPALFGRTGLVCVHPVTKNPRLDTVAAVDDVTTITVNHDGKLAVICYLEDLARPPGALGDVMGVPPERTFVQHAPPLRPPGAALSRSQWRVVEALVRDARIGPTELARRTGLSRKVAQRHLRFLLDGGHVIPQTWLMSGRTSGAAFYEVYAQGPAAAEPEGVRRALGPRAWVVDRLSEPVGALLLGLADDLGGAIAAHNRVLSMPGIEHAELIFAYEFAWAPERIERWCREAAATARV